MARNTLYMVSEDYTLTQRFKMFCEQNGVDCEVFTHQEWEAHRSTAQPKLSQGQSPIEQQGATIIPFPNVGNFSGPVTTKVEGKVRTINELESIAIENAIHEFNGNLTEAAKALGIGRATLYRKVKQYNIDPSSARRKRAS